jgi:putative redox protein
MGVEIDVVYQGELRCVAKHGPSQTALTTDAPVDNHGKGESFSPTDLVATALGSCILTTMGIVAQRHNIDMAGTQVHVVKEMVQQPVRRIGALPVRVTFPADKAAKLSPADRTLLENAARHCPVYQSLHPDVDHPLEFVYLQ